MKFSNTCFALAVAGTMAVAPGCKDFYNVNVNPLSPSSTTLSSLLPVTQITMAENLGDNVGGLSQYTMSLMQQLYNTRSIGNFMQTAGSFSGEWTGLYTGTLINNELVITQGTTEKRWDYVGIAQLQKAYIFSQMVDLWGDMPYSEALQGATSGATSIAPHFDKDADIYNGTSTIQGLFALIDEGMANLDKPTTGVIAIGTSDIIYGGSPDKWKRFGRTLKLKLYNQIRKTNTDAAVQAQVTPLLNAQLIDESSDFQIVYNSSVTPDNRNPGYAQDYSANPESRVGRYFYEGMVTLRDPRVPYYFYNQLAKGATTTMQDYVSSLDPRFVTVRPGSSGPYTSSASTAGVQTVQGLYSIGGKYDDGLGKPVNTTQGKGKASAPQRLLTYYSRKFTEAELQLTVFNSPTAAATALEEGVRAAFRKVNVVATADVSPVIPDVPATTGPAVLNIQDYVTAMLARYNAATTTEDKLEVIMYEKYVASYGYGVDVYTDFRRTRHPKIRVSSQVADAAQGLLPDDGGTIGQGAFPRRLFYPTYDLLLNPNSPRTQASTPIFWDR